MIRIDNSTFSPEVASTRAAASSPPLPANGPASEGGDEVQLSHAAALPEGRADRLAALKSVVSSADYLPPSLPVSRKLISGALSRDD
jgi:hypothetical protein